jgi:hypothetical protein
MNWMLGELFQSSDPGIPRPFLPLVTCVLDLGARSILQIKSFKSVETIRGHSKTVWVIEDGAAYTLLHPEDY